MSNISNVHDVSCLVSIHNDITKYNYESYPNIFNDVHFDEWISKEGKHLIRKCVRKKPKINHSEITITQHGYKFIPKKNINYNEDLYKNIVNIAEKYDIVYYDKERSYDKLFRISKLRYDLYGAMIIDSQIYHFLIEFDELKHFNEYTTIESDLKKEIYSWYVCTSLLRIYYKDDIQTKIELFLDEIKSLRRPIIRYSDDKKYEDRFNTLKRIESSNNHVKLVATKNTGINKNKKRTEKYVYVDIDDEENKTFLDKYKKEFESNK